MSATNLLNFANFSSDQTATMTVPVHPSAPSFEVHADEIDAHVNAWLDTLVPHVPFEKLVFFDADIIGLTRATYFNGRTLKGCEVVSASMVFCLPSGEFLYEKKALEMFVEGRDRGLWEECVYWGPKFEMGGKVGEETRVGSITKGKQSESDKAFYDLSSYVTTAQEEAGGNLFEVEVGVVLEENPFLDDEAVLEELAPFRLFDGTHTLPEAYDDDDSSEPVELALSDEDSESEASFGCIGAAEHDETIASSNAVANAVDTLSAFAMYQRTPPQTIMQFVKQVVAAPVLTTTLPSRSVFVHFERETLPFRRPFYAGPPKYFPKKSAPPPPIKILPSASLYRQVYVQAPGVQASRIRSATRAAPRRDQTVALHALQANIRDAGLVWPTYEHNWAPLAALPRPRMRVHPLQPVASVWQPMHPEIKAILETAKPLFRTVIHSGPDFPLSWDNVEFGWEKPKSLTSLDALRMQSEASFEYDASVYSLSNEDAGMIPGPLRVWKTPSPSPSAHEEQDEYGYPTAPVPWAQAKSLWDRRVQWPSSRVVRNAAGKLELVDAFPQPKPEVPKARESLLRKPWTFVKKLVTAATREREWIS
ncbi:hypothetical protein BU23DRAFT_601357 [Bimuria novae-zelandiae CBS 107.79]|uniref:Uncharacterized protein n=1 Tax=Bimuria novae-zelandiae CBS 107.79 TaxID=1447943 RepID=A0A6A5V0L2_9PLEO|nr:hypothetical protein BU23DRAFT_601357 [Bimuria novae-zelandiae CBS 107.79]